MTVDPVSLAITAALTAANMALTASQTTYGPRIKGTPATVADYGTPLNYFLGTRLVSCPCFFAKQIKEVKKKRKSKGGKQVTYTGFGTWAIHIADHQIGGVLQVWFDNHLVYDNTGSSEKIYPLADDYELESFMRVYLGTEEQDPDPDMLAYIEARDGAGTCPAYRGTSYIYFENIPLEQLGNRYPDVKVMAYQNSALTVAEDTEIDFVGQQQVAFPSTGSSDITFALTGGIDTTPQAGDLVLIANAAGRYPLDTGDGFLGGVDGYDEFGDGFFTQSLIADFKFQMYSKFMGGTPDTTFTVNGGDPLNGTSDRNGYQVMVFRGVDPAILASDISTISGTGPASYDPADIDLGTAVFDPGDIGGTVVASHYVFHSFALLSAANGQAMPIVMGAQCEAGGANEGVGNMLNVYQFDTTGGAGARSVRPYALFGREVLVGEGTTLAAVLTFVAQRAGLDADEYSFGLVSGSDYGFTGYNWSQGSGQQIGEALCDLFDVDIRPHDFTIEALPRGGSSAGSLATGEFTADSAPFTIPDRSDSSLPQRVFLTYADSTADQNPNAAMPQGGEGSGGDISIDMQTLAMTPTLAQQLVERRQRRERFGRIEAQFGLTRQRLALEPGDVWTPAFDGDAMVMRCTKLTIGADGRMPVEWQRDDPAIAALPNSEGAAASGYVPDTVPDAVDSIGTVLDLPLLLDAHDQSAPLAYLTAGPEEPGTWTGADIAASDTGELDSYTEGWDGIAASDGAVIGTCTAGLPDALPWVVDMGSSVEVTINAGELTAATLDALLLDGTLNLAAVESADGWELVQFMTPTLTGDLTYTITGFLRGVRGTEWAMADHAPSDRFIVLADAKRHTMGAGEIGDTDWYVVSTTGQAIDESDAFTLAYTGASHKPYVAVYGSAEQSGADWVFDATRRTRIGGNTLDGQDVPLGEASESWALDIYDGVDVVRTITGTSLPLTYLEADQITDFGSAQSSVDAQLYQVDPTLNLRGYPLALAA